MEDLFPTDPVKVEPREGFSIWIEFVDGTSGTVDLSHLVDGPVFAPWADREFFESVHISDDVAIQWGKDIDLCPDALYLEVTGKTAEEVVPGLRSATVDV